MKTLPLSELEFAAALAKLTPADPTPEQRELAGQLLLQYSDMCLALQTLSVERVRIKHRLGELQVATATAVAASMRPPVQTSGPTTHQEKTS